jgi:multidrug efflux pump subunit AcrA (membrane-fusion protein)
MEQPAPRQATRVTETPSAPPQAARPARRAIADSRPRSRRPLLASAALVLVLGTVAGGAWWLGQQPDAGADDQPNTRTAAVERTSLEAGLRLAGALGYGEATPLAGAHGAIVTRLPEAGQTIAAGQVIMEVEGSPVFLLQGDLPLWRDIKPGVTGPDVQNLRDALARLGLDAGEGQTYDDTLSAAIAQLYTANGYPEPVAMAEDKADQERAKAALDEAQQALANAQADLTRAKNTTAGSAQLAEAQARVNQARRDYDRVLSGQCADEAGPQACSDNDIQAAQEALDVAQASLTDLTKAPDTAAEQRAVDAAQKAANQAQADYDETCRNVAGTKNILIVPEAEIRIDDIKVAPGEAISGTILTWTKAVLYGTANLTAAQRRMLSTGVAATLEFADGTLLTGTVDKITEATRDGYQEQATVRIALDDQAAAAAQGPSAVTISFIQQTAADTLVVPVSALVVTAEGAYAVQRTDGTYVRVELGLQADARIEIRSDVLAEGDLVVIP